MRNRTAVSDYVTLQRGITYKGNLVGKPGPALLGLGSIHPGGGFREGDYKTYGGECPPKIMLHAGDLFASLKGATKDGKMIGSVARVPESVPLGRLTQDTVKLEFRNHDLEESNFLYWVLRTPQYRDYCAGRATGSAVVALSRDDFLSYPVPNLNAFRRRIVNLLEALDEKIELNRRMNATLEGMAQALFKSWFADFDPVIDNALAAGNPIPDALQAKAECRMLNAERNNSKFITHHSSFPSAFQLTEEMGWIPEGWEVKPLSDFGKIVTGKTPPKAIDKAFGENSMFLTPTDYDGDILTIETKRRLSTLGEESISNSRIEKGSICVTCIGSQMGRTTLVTQEAFTNQQINSISPRNLNHRYYILINLRLREEEIFAIGSSGSTMPIVNKGFFSKLPILRPSEDTLEIYNQYSFQILEKMKNNSYQVHSLTKLRDTLLPKLISGELRVLDAEKLIEVS